jgi:hypothetical protein
MWIDRIQLVTPDRAATAESWFRLLAAELAREDKLGSLGALRTTLAVGTSEVELLEPDGAGPVADFAAARGGAGLFAAGFAVEDVAALAADLRARSIDFAEEGGQLLLAPAATGGTGLRVVVSRRAVRERVGLIERLYEVTNLVADVSAASDALVKTFGLDPAPFVPIRSENYGYDGVLTLFRAGELDRVEIIHPYDGERTMGRFFGKRGPCLYMCYGETDRPAEVRERALTHVPNDWTGSREGDRPDNQFLHPRALGGVMLGVSRTSFAWSWSGAPDRIAP